MQRQAPGAARSKLREALDGQLARPLDPKLAAEHDRAQWGLSDEAVAMAARKDAIFGSSSYE